MTRRALALGFLSLFVGCSKGPDIPLLQNNTPAGPSVIFRKELHAEDIRNLFRNVNGNGRLDGLKPFLETPPDAALEPMAGLLTRQVYRELDSPHGLILATQAAIDEHAFTRAAQTAKAIASEPGYRERAEVVLSAASDPSFPALARRDRRWLDAEWGKLLLANAEKANASYKETKNHPTVPPVSPAVLTSDLRQLVGTPQAREALAAKVGPLFDSHAFFPLARLTATLHATAPFEGLGYGLANILSEPPTVPDTAFANRLDQTLGFVHGLDHASEGMFSTVAVALREESAALKYAAQTLLPVYARTVKNNLRTRLAGRNKAFWLGLVRPAADKPSASFVPFFQATRDALSDLIGPERQKDAADEFAFNLTLDFDAYALTRWAETLAATNVESWKAMPEGDFAKAIWLKATKDEMQPLDCTDKKKLAAPVAADFKVLGLERLAKAADEAITRWGYGDFTFAFVGGDFQTFDEAAQSAVEAVNNSRPFVDPEPTVKLAVQYLLEPDSSGKSLLEHLESDNLLHSVQGLLGGLGAEGWQTTKAILFEKLGLDQLSPDWRGILIGFYKDKPDLAARFTSLLDGLPLLVELDRGVDGLPSPFSFYQSLLRQADNDQKTALGNLLSYAGEAGWLGKNGTTPRFPAFQTLISDGGKAARALQACSVLSHDDAETVNLGLTEMFAQNGFRQHLDLFATLLQTQPKGVEAWVRTLSHSFAMLALPAALQAWAYRFVSEPDFLVLMQFFREQGNRASALQLVRELKTLQQNGELKETINFLGYLRNDRLKDLGVYLKAWEASGELAQALDAVESLLAPLAGPAAPAHFTLRK